MAVNFSNPVDVLARTLWAEARGEGVQGMHAVANVVMNRAKHPRWWGSSVVSVCLKPYQFSSWNLDDPNRAQLENVDSSDPQFVEAIQLAETAVNGELEDITMGSDSYYAITIPAPVWANEPAFRVQIGNQKFYRVELV